MARTADVNDLSTGPGPFKGRWLLWILPFLFLGLIFYAAWSRDPDFWRSTPSLHQQAKAAAAQGDFPRALELASKAWAREPDNAGYGIFLGRIYLDAGQVKAALEVSRQIMGRAPGTNAIILQAQSLDLLGERAEALAVLAGYLQSQPEDRQVLATAAAIAARSEGDYPVAVTYYQQLYHLTGDPLARHELLRLLMSLQRFKEAIVLQQEEIAQFPESVEALHQLALLYYWQRDYEAASGVYQQLLERNPGNVAYYQEAAKVADAAENPDQALARYLWLYGHDQGKKEYALVLARLWSQKGNHAEAAGVLAPLMAEQPAPELRRWYGLELLLIGDFDKAFHEYRTAWEAGDTHKETIINLARLYGRKRRFAKAAAMWDEALRRQLVTGDIRWEAALTFSYAQRFKDALEVVAPLRSQHPQDPKLLLFSGQLNFYQKHWGQAAHFFNDYLALNPKDAEVRRQLAEALSFKPETRNEAAAEYGAILKDQDVPDLRLRRIGLLLENRQWEEAARELQNSPVPDDPRLIFQQARLYLWLGSLNEALQRCDLVLQKAPNDPDGRLLKAQVLTYLGRGPEALEILNRLRMEQPDNHGLRVAAIEAYITNKDFGKALALAQKELEPLPDLSPNERALVARCYWHSADPGAIKHAADLALENLRKNRYHHPSLLILAAVVPKLPHYEDLDQVMYRLAGGGVETSSSLAFFDGQMGRQGGKVNYVLRLLQERRHHKWPEAPGELLSLAWLAMELDDKPAAEGYYRKFLRLKPNDPAVGLLLQQCLESGKQWDKALSNLEKDGTNPHQLLEMARLYMIRGQYEGVKATVARLPEGNPDRPAASLLMVAACRSEHNYPEALQILTGLEGKVPPAEVLMEKARVLEAMGDKGAVAVYQEIVDLQPGSQAARVARARQARARGNWGAAYKDYAEALKESPQDIELLNELEDIRSQMRPQIASRGFPYPRGERNPEEAHRPFQYSRFGREPQGLGFSNYLPAIVSDVLPIVQPETLYFSDSNKLYGAVLRASGAFWITKVLPANLGIEYREYNQHSDNVKMGPLDLGLTSVYTQGTNAASRLRRAEISLGLGPAAVNDRLRLTGEIILRRYWKHTEYGNVQTGQFQYTIPGFVRPFPPPPAFIQSQTFTVDNQIRNNRFGREDSQNRFLGSLELGFSLTPRTDASLRYSRRDIFDQEAYLFPRLYQSVQKLAELPLLTYHQVDFSYNHQFRPGLNWRGSIGGAFFSDDNRRLTLYQGLAWQAIKEPRMHLEFTPHYFMTTYADRHPAYFSPGSYQAFGVGLDFDRQIFRLPTLILQGALQGVGQDGRWGPAVQGLAALEWEFIQNFYTDLHAFYFKEWADNYHLFTAGVSFRWRF